MAEYEYLSKKDSVPDSREIIKMLSSYPVTSVHSDNTVGRIIIKTSEPLSEEQKEEVGEIVRGEMKDAEKTSQGRNRGT